MSPLGALSAALWVILVRAHRYRSQPSKPRWSWRSPRVSSPIMSQSRQGVQARHYACLVHPSLRMDGEGAVG